MTIHSDNLKIDIERALEFRDRGAAFVDVRSPAEFAETSIPGAVNIPLFSDEERAEIGTLYKQVGKQEARFRGIEIVSPKIPQFIRQARMVAETAAGLPLVAFCWRGGERSRAMTSFFDLAGIPARQLIGGHKRFRRHVLDYFERPDWGRVLVLRGLTGVGKTVVLKRLAAAGQPVVDLEGLANHRGSAFGNLGLEKQPGQKQFETLLWDALRRFKGSRYVLVEGESRHIGRVALPKTLHEAMQIETSIWLKADIETRVKCILADYPARDEMKSEFTRPIEAIREKLGHAAANQMLELLDAGQWEELVRKLMVDYYDPLYRHTFPERRIEVEVEPFTGPLAPVEAAIEAILAEGQAVSAGAGS